MSAPDGIDKYGKLAIEYFYSQFELRLWQLIANGVVTRAELIEYYSLDDVLKLAAIVEMNADIKAAELEKAADKLKRKEG